MKFSTLNEFVRDATERMEQHDESFRILDITNPIAENHLEGEESRFTEDIDESLSTEMIVNLLEAARCRGPLVNDLCLGFFQLDHEISMSLVKLFHDEQRTWKRLTIQRCAGRILESCLSIVTTRGNLESLCLHQNNLGYTGFSAVAMIMASNPSKLITLDVEDFISPNAALAFSAGLKMNRTLQTLDLHDCRFDRDALELIAVGISQHPSLSQLIVSKCQLTDANAAFLVNTIVDHPTVRKIVLSLNYCSVKSLKALAAATRGNRMPQFTTLVLNYQCSQLIDPRLTMPLPIGILGGALENNNCLKTLSLSDNVLESAELDFFLHGLKESRLRALYVARCGIDEEGLIRLLSRLPANTIQTLDISENLFVSEASDAALIQAAEDCVSLEFLKMDRDLECWSQVCYQTRLNRGGRRIMKKKSGKFAIPRGLWAMLLEHVNKIDWSEYDNFGNAKGFREDVIFAILKGPVLSSR